MRIKLKRIIIWHFLYSTYSFFLVTKLTIASTKNLINSTLLIRIIFGILFHFQNAITSNGHSILKITLKIIAINNDPYQLTKDVASKIITTIIPVRRIWKQLSQNLTSLVLSEICLFESSIFFIILYSGVIVSLLFCYNSNLPTGMTIKVFKNLAAPSLCHSSFSEHICCLSKPTTGNETSSKP